MGIFDKLFKPNVEKLKAKIEELRSDNDDVQSKAHLQLEKWAEGGDKRFVSPLIEVLDQGNDSARSLAANLLGIIRDKRSVGALIKALQDKTWDVRYEAIEALGNIGDPQAIKPIKQCVIKATAEEERVRGRGMIVLDEVFNMSKAELRQVFLKSNASDEAKRQLKPKKKSTVKPNIVKLKEKKKKRVESVTFVKKKHRDGNTYEVYTAENKKQAWEFIKTKSVNKKRYYIEVNVGDVNDPELIVGLDILGTYET
jgi:hypothetical protein